MAACLTSTKCVAFDLGTVGCVLHNDIDDLTTSRYVIGITQFLLNRYCLPTSLLSTESPPATTISARTTSMSRNVLVYNLKCCHFCIITVLLLYRIFSSKYVKAPIICAHVVAFPLLRHNACNEH